MMLYAEIEKTFCTIEKILSKESLDEFKDTSLHNLYSYHYSLGTWIRNNFLYPKNNALYDLFSENGIYHADDMSDIIIRLFHYHSYHRNTP